MTVKLITDAESIARQQQLVQAMDARADRYADMSAAEGAHGHGAFAMEFALLSNCCRQVADQARARLVNASELTLDDAEQLAAIQADEPPAPLVDLTAWLRTKLGKWFPVLPPQGWQSIAWVLHQYGRPS